MMSFVFRVKINSHAPGFDGDHIHRPDVSDQRKRQVGHLRDVDGPRKLLIRYTHGGYSEERDTNPDGCEHGC